MPSLHPNTDSIDSLWSPYPLSYRTTRHWGSSNDYGVLQNPLSSTQELDHYLPISVLKINAFYYSLPSYGSYSGGYVLNAPMSTLDPIILLIGSITTATNAPLL